MRTEDEVCELVLRAWTDVRIGRANTAHALAEAFRSRPQITHETRAAVARALFGMLHEARRIDCALAIEARAPAPNANDAQPSSANDARLDRARYFAWRVLAGESPPNDSALGELGWNPLEIARVDQRIAQTSDPLRRFALSHSLPDFIAGRLLADHGADAALLCASLRERPPVTLRANTLKTTRAALIERLTTSGVRAHATRFSSEGVELEEHTNVFVLPEFHEGWFEVQDEASQLAAELVAPPPRGTVVDFCAGAGGKTLAIGAQMKNQGTILALDPSARRLKELRRRAARAGLFNVQFPAADRVLVPVATGAKGALAPRSADRVLVDAPCSGFGAVRRKPDIRWRVSEEDLERLPREQEAIAARAMELVAPGGRLVYATCTLFADENERVVERLLARGGFELVLVKEIVGAERALAITDPSGSFLKLAPHRHGTDGFFAAILRRKRAKSAKSVKP
jgi:16S rRNA (cytosine967-C5)-methyltransferase